MKVIFHPLFAIAVIAAFAAGLGFFVLAMIAAVLIHEVSHIIAARRFGAYTGELRLLPFGAEIGIDCALLRTRERVLVLLAGSFGNILTALATGCFLWLFPNLFMVFEFFIIANAIPAVLNLLPIYPLDGGKIIYLLLQEKSAEKAKKWTKSFQIFSNGVFAALFLFGCFVSFNPSLLILCTVMLFTINTEMKHNKFVSKLVKTSRVNKHIVREIAVNGDMTLLQIYGHVSPHHYTKFIITDRQNAEFFEDSLERWLLVNSADTKLSRVVA